MFQNYQYELSPLFRFCVVDVSGHTLNIYIPSIHCSVKGGSDLSHFRASWKVDLLLVGLLCPQTCSSRRACSSCQFSLCYASSAQLPAPEDWQSALGCHSKSHDDYDYGYDCVQCWEGSRGLGHARQDSTPELRPQPRISILKKPNAVMLCLLPSTSAIRKSLTRPFLPSSDLQKQYEDMR